MPEKLGGQCDRAKPVEPGHDYLATPIYLLKGDERMRRRKDHSKGFLQINDEYFWHGFDPQLASETCACMNGGRCETKSRLGKSARANAKILPNAPPVDVFEAFCHGAAIIGGPKTLQNRPPKNSPPMNSQECLTPEPGPSPQTQAGGGKWKRSFGRIDAFLKRKI